jgi:hypothetical protein
MNPEFMGLYEIVHFYLDGKVSSQQLETWVIGRLQEQMDKLKLMQMIDCGMIEIGEGLISEDEFKSKLRKEVTP